MGCKNIIRAFENKNGGTTADDTSGRVSVRVRRNREQCDEPGLFWEYCRDYGNDDCLLIALNCYFRTRLSESIEQFMNEISKSYKKKVNIKYKLKIKLFFVFF